MRVECIPRGAHHQKKNRSTFVCAYPYGNLCFASLNCKFCPWLRQIQNVAPSDFVGASFRAERITKKRTGAPLCSCSLLVTRTGIEPMFPAWEASVLTAWPTGRIWRLGYYTTIFIKNQGVFEKIFRKNYFFIAFPYPSRFLWILVRRFCLRCKGLLAVFCTQSYEVWR